MLLSRTERQTAFCLPLFFSSENLTASYGGRSKGGGDASPHHAPPSGRTHRRSEKKKTRSGFSFSPKSRLSPLPSSTSLAVTPKMAGIDTVETQGFSDDSRKPRITSKETGRLTDERRAKEKRKKEREGLRLRRCRAGARNRRFL